MNLVAVYAVEHLVDSRDQFLTLDKQLTWPEPGYVEHVIVIVVYFKIQI